MYTYSDKFSSGKACVDNFVKQNTLMKLMKMAMREFLLHFNTYVCAYVM